MPDQTAGMSADERKVLRSFVSSQKATIGVDDVINLRPISRAAANQVLARLQRKGWLMRVKRGRYTVVPLASSTPEPALEDVWPVASELFAPCFISGWSAAEHWDLTEQIFNAVAVVTTRHPRRAEDILTGTKVRIRFLPQQRFFGCKTVWIGTQRIEVADPHRLMIDILDDPSFGGGARHTLDIARAYWTSKHADSKVVLAYAKRFGRGTVFKRLGFTGETWGNVDQRWIDECRREISAGVSKLDPKGPNRGRILTRWNLRINVPIEAQ